ncbi:uncharacterized protein [Physcomitrium patens]|uniref:Phosphatidylinositol-specific phospholipase C X domain-containing protein n=1 Tax=Physcomitrium patens TaxID=3218 RepID=A9TWL1_PHYPA|nr:uncharacterized protein LOC112287286 [Physcomitrium patens]XP_024385928.1 uncharacterized protein LOC112287286 [Physcomitrium patens]XP_024385929.1 uncharacterized protein LOC112287286 [Physcomitrium patens]XP_024385930.1 uncharacterized protein LOC112287286 [Physcomitrium patens]PNR46748.1 hypothetical protein PHYPA_013868 [Physcomitrium patens]|eukprot:XP_024385927.1 uncharacterized protein LOC112287286 [Physcomitrella patens]
MGAQVSKERLVKKEKRQLKEKVSTCDITFPGCDFHHPNHKEWMSTLPLQNLKLRDVVWPGTHDSATNKIGVPGISRPFARCQKLSCYNQLCIGVRVLDIRVQEDRRVCHGCLKSYLVDVVINDLKKFLAETSKEFVILEIRTEFNYKDPPAFDQWLISQLGDHLVPQNASFLGRPLIELLPKRVICIWRPRQSPAPSPGSPLWSSAYLKDNWIDTDLPLTKFSVNITNLQKHPPNDQRSYFYRVENTATPQVTGPVLCVYPVTSRIRGYARLFLAEVFKEGLGDRLQIFSGDFVEPDFVDNCIGVTIARNNLQLEQSDATG